MRPNYEETVDLDDNIGTYTAPADGYIVSLIWKNSVEIGYSTSVYVNNVIVGYVSCTTGGIITSVMVPVSAGDIIRWAYENPTYCKSFGNKFIPA